MCTYVFGQKKCTRYLFLFIGIYVEFSMGTAVLLSIDSFYSDSRVEDPPFTFFRVFEKDILIFLWGSLS